MARGITEEDVHSAADALVCAGERPTVERIRAHLGTGSPNTVILRNATPGSAIARAASRNNRLPGRHQYKPIRLAAGAIAGSTPPLLWMAFAVTAHANAAASHALLDIAMVTPERA